MAMLVTLCWGLQSVVDPGFTKGGGGGAYNNGCLLSLRPHIYNIITKTTGWEVVKNSASPKRPFFFFFGFRVIFPVFRAFPSSPSKAKKYLDAQKGESICLNA